MDKNGVFAEGMFCGDEGTGGFALAESYQSSLQQLSAFQQAACPVGG